MGFGIENGILKKYYEENGVTDVIIPDSVTSIGMDVFLYCDSLTKVIYYGTKESFDSIEIDSDTRKRILPLLQYAQKPKPARKSAKKTSSPETSAPAGKMKFCPFCGGKLFANAPFCAFCGEKLPAL